MCGICGVFNLDGQSVSGPDVEAMRDTMPHRGPDGAGLFVDVSIGLGHRRLSIIDLEGGAQPLANEDGTVVVVFNGEIYNFNDLRPRLASRGHLFKTRSDTEVIVHQYEESGPGCVSHFRGMFAFALWDGRSRTLMLARDRLGVKPLYYALVGRRLLFGSEIKSLLQAEPSLATPDPRGLRRYLAYRHPYGHGTLFSKVQQVPPGHYLLAGEQGLTLRRYWDAPQRQEGASDGGPHEFLPLLEEAVQLRMISDVPLGSFLSGGIDSSVITALMARHTQQVRTFSIGFVPEEESELSWARRVADHCQADHHEFTLGSRDFFSQLGTLVWHHDEPLTFPASIPLYLLSRNSKPLATVMLAGEGADEILAGYGNNIRAYWLSRMAGLAPGGVWNALARSVPAAGRTGSMARRIALPEQARILGAFRLAGHIELQNAARLDLPPGVEDDQVMAEELGLTARRGTFLDRLLYFQLKSYLVALLMKQDKMSMAASIETRVPYLDHRLVELAFGYSDDMKIRGRHGKHLLRKAAQSLIPQDVITRPKRGFPVPIAQWFRGPRNPFIEVLLDPASLRDGLLDANHVRARVQHFIAGGDNSMEIWSMLNLELWRREFLAPGTRASAASRTGNASKTASVAV